MKNIFKHSRGATSTILLVLGVVLIIVIVVVYIVIRTGAIKNAGTKPATTEETVTGPPPPVYDTNIGDVKFIFIQAQDLGNNLTSPNKSFSSNLTTTEKFIKVTIGAQNVGKLNIAQQSWDLGNMVDSEGRNFINIDNAAYSFLPRPNLCGTLLKPEFEPTPCVRYYEVSKASDSFKIEVYATPAGKSKKEKGFLDLLITQ